MNEIIAYDSLFVSSGSTVSADIGSNGGIITPILVTPSTLYNSPYYVLVVRDFLSFTYFNIIFGVLGSYDTDQDGIPDYLDDNPLDTDNDGINNVSDADDDNDGVNDADEIIIGTNPLVTDSNGNGIADGDEDFDQDGSTNSQESISSGTVITDVNGDGTGDLADNSRVHDILLYSMDIMPEGSLMGITWGPVTYDLPSFTTTLFTS